NRSLFLSSRRPCRRPGRVDRWNNIHSINKLSRSRFVFFLAAGFAARAGALPTTQVVNCERRQSVPWRAAC
ncbi:hypothetical protein L0222_32125, partial [bacterium]|nr:hypothetical protein [bacterium]